MSERQIGGVLIAAGAVIGLIIAVLGLTPGFAGIAQTMETPGFVLGFALSGVVVALGCALVMPGSPNDL